MSTEEKAARQQEFDAWWQVGPLYSSRYRNAYYDVSRRAWLAAIDHHPRSEAVKKELLQALQALPLESFGEDMEAIDAAEFVDHAGEFFKAMGLAKAAIAKARGVRIED